MSLQRALSRSYLRVGRFLSYCSCDSRFVFHGLTTDVPRRSFNSSSGMQEVKRETKEALVSLSEVQTKESANGKQRKTANEQKAEAEAEGNRKGFFKIVRDMAIGGILVSFAIGYFGLDGTKVPKDTVENTTFLTAQDIRESTIHITDPTFEKNYIHRPAVEKELDDFVEGELKEKYLIVYGAKGTGKSSVALKTLSEKKGVALVKVRNYVDWAQLSKKVAQAVMNTEQKVTVESINIHEALAKAKIATDIHNVKNADKRKYPTIVFEVEGGADQDIHMLENVQSLSKDFVSVANVIIILSEAMAVTTFGQVHRREKYMYVGDMTREEAKELLEKRGKHLNDTDFSYLYENIGGCPTALTDFARGEVSVQDFVRTSLNRASNALKTFPPQHRELLVLLKQHPEGVRFDDYPVVDMQQFGKEMGRKNVVYYDIDQEVFKLQSRALKVALKDYAPK